MLVNDYRFSDNPRVGAPALPATAFALRELTAAEEAKIDALVKKAVSED
jgi:hypothetical protein